MTGTLAATPAADEPRREATPPTVEHRTEVEVEEVATSSPRAATPPLQWEAVEETAATEAAGASGRPEEARAKEATVEPHCNPSKQCNTPKAGRRGFTSPRGP